MHDSNQHTDQLETIAAEFFFFQLVEVDTE